MVIISGIMPGVQGVGRLLSYLQQESTKLPKGVVRFVFGPAGTAGTMMLRKGEFLRFLAAIWKFFQGKMRLSAALYDPALYKTDEPVLLIHFQTLGYNWCRRFIEKRSSPTWLYIMDSGFFCIRSYNYVHGEHKACLRCLGGRWWYAKEHNCHPIPFTNLRAKKLLEQLKRWVKTGKVKLLVQNRTQAKLAYQHFGNDVEISIVGLWTADWPKLETIPPLERSQNGQYDVVFHASPVPAKGFIWAIKLARHCPSLKFLFPCFRSDLERLGESPPANAHFDYMRWETGLAEAVTRAKLVLVPSLWSAAIEGALLKSIIFARSVAVADEATTFAGELPDRLVLRLPLDVSKAAKILVKSVESGWRPAEKLRQKWINEFYQKNDNLLNRLLSVCQAG